MELVCKKYLSIIKRILTDKIMKAPHKFIILLTASLVLFSGCGQSHKSESMADMAVMSEMDEVPVPHAPASPESTRAVSGSIARSEQIPNLITTAAALTVNDGDRLLIRAADSRFKVKNVTEATYAIESIIIKNGGIIMNSSIGNDKYAGQEIPVSEDSAMIVTYNNLVANLELRIPKNVLDETLREIAPLAVEIDYRRLQANDVTFDILMKQLTEARLGRKSKRVTNAIATRSAKLEDAVNAEEALDNVEEMADRTTIEKYKLKDKIDFSTISLKLYQDRFETRTMVKRAEAIDAYEPGLGLRALDSLSNGWTVLCSILILLLNLWPLFLIAFVGAFVYFKFRKKASK